MHAPAARNEVFNIGADMPYTVNELAQVVAAAFGVEPDIRHLAARHEVLHAYASHDKARRAFGAGARTLLAEGVTRMAAWAKSVGARRSGAFSAIEVGRDLPAAWLEDGAMAALQEA